MYVLYYKETVKIKQPIITDFLKEGDRFIKTYNVRIKRDIIYAIENDTELLLDLYIPEELSVFPLLVFFYGGGLESGSKDGLMALANEFAASGIAFAAPNYRLFPDVSYPVFIEDAAKAITWVSNNVDGMNNLNRIFVGGHSAGAYISMMLCFDKSYLSSNGIASDKLGGFIFASGQPTTHFNVLNYRGQDSALEIIDTASPIFHVNSNGAPVLVICTDNDVPGRLEQTKQLISILDKSAYKSDVDIQLLEGYDHGSYFEPDESGNSKFFTIAKAFIKRHYKTTDIRL